MSDCPFCKVDRSHGNFIMSSEHDEVGNPIAYAIWDSYPATEQHTLILPARHVKSFFVLNEEEHEEIKWLLISMKIYLMNRDKTIEGFNIGWNCGEVAGQTVMHAHCHLIPRRLGDHPNPRGGVRAVIPGKADY